MNIPLVKTIDFLNWLNTLTEPIPKVWVVECEHPKVGWCRISPAFKVKEDAEDVVAEVVVWANPESVIVKEVPDETVLWDQYVRYQKTKNQQ